MVESEWEEAGGSRGRGGGSGGYGYDDEGFGSGNRGRFNQGMMVLFIFPLAGLSMSSFLVRSSYLLAHHI